MCYTEDSWSWYHLAVATVTMWPCDQPNVTRHCTGSLVVTTGNGDTGPGSLKLITPGMWGLTARLWKTASKWPSQICIWRIITNWSVSHLVKLSDISGPRFIVTGQIKYLLRTKNIYCDGCKECTRVWGECIYCILSSIFLRTVTLFCDECDGPQGVWGVFYSSLIFCCQNIWRWLDEDDQTYIYDQSHISVKGVSWRRRLSPIMWPRSASPLITWQPPLSWPRPRPAPPLMLSIHWLLPAVNW